MGQVSSWIAGETLAVLRGFVREHKLGWVFPANSRYQCVPNLCGKVRQPDVSFLRSARLPNGRLFDEDVPFAPDLAIEVISQRDFCEIFDLKISEYQSAGVTSIWVISPKTRTCTIHRLSGQTLRLKEGDTITEPELLPGFSCRVGDLLPPPEAVPPIEMEDDE